MLVVPGILAQVVAGTNETVYLYVSDVDSVRVVGMAVLTKHTSMLYRRLCTPLSLTYISF